MVVSVYITCKDEKEAREISVSLLRERLIACANIFPVRSFYWWQEKIADEREFAIIAKSKKENFQKVKEFVKSMHSYEVPCIVAWEVKEGNEDYLNWVREETGGLNEKTD